MADDMRTEQGQGSGPISDRIPQDDSGVGNGPLTPAEDAIEIAIDSVEKQPDDHDELSPTPRAVFPPALESRPKPPVRELTPEAQMNAEFASLRSSITTYKRDLGIDPILIQTEERKIKPPSNVRKGKREELMRTTRSERQSLAVQAFPRYLAAWREADSENTDIIASYERMFEKAGEKGMEDQVAVIDEARSQLSRILSIKSTYYTEMLTTLLVDSGIPLDEAEEQVMLEHPPLTSAASIPENAQSLRDLKEKAVNQLVDELGTTVEAWDAIYPGLGEEEEMKIMASPEHERTRLTKDLYKRVHQELERRRGEYKQRVSQALNARDLLTYEANVEAARIEVDLKKLSRADQIRTMRLDEDGQPEIDFELIVDATERSIMGLYKSIAEKLLKLGDPTRGGDPAKYALGQRFLEGLGNPETYEATRTEIDSYLTDNSKKDPGERDF